MTIRIKFDKSSKVIATIGVFVSMIIIFLHNPIDGYVTGELVDTTYGELHAEAITQRNANYLSFKNDYEKDCVQNKTPNRFCIEAKAMVDKHEITINTSNMDEAFKKKYCKNLGMANEYCPLPDEIYRKNKFKSLPIGQYQSRGSLVSWLETINNLFWSLVCIWIFCISAFLIFGLTSSKSHTSSS